MRRFLTAALGGLVLSCQGPAAVLAAVPATVAVEGAVTMSEANPARAIGP